MPGKQPALGRRHIGEVLQPYLIWAIGRGGLGQTVGSDGVIMVAVGGLRHKAGFALRPQFVLPHQPRHAVLAARVSAALECCGHAGAAVAGFRSLAPAPDFFQQARVGLLPGRGLAKAMGVIARTAHVKRRAQFTEWIILFHGLNALIAVAHVVETMPKVFFRISRC